MNNQPLFLLKHWVRETKDRREPSVRYSVFSDEDHLIKFLRTVYGNYTVYNIGQPYKSKDEFDKIFKEEQEEKERQEYLKLKAKFENEQK